MIEFRSNTSPQVRHAAETAEPILAQLNIREGIRLQEKDGMPGEFHCSFDDGILTIIGDAEGLRCGLYRVLQKLGVRHFSPTEALFIPEKPDLGSLAALDGFTERPGFTYRGLHICGVPNQFDENVAFWMSFNGFNRKLTHIPQLKKIGAELEKFGIKPDTTVHSYDFFIPDSVYFEKNPEYFSLIGGTRVRQSAGGQLCISNPDLRKEFIRRVVDYIRANPETGLVGVCPNDGFGWCECESCRALDSAEDRKKNSVNSRVAAFVEAVSAGVAKECPEVKLGHYSYSIFSRFSEYLTSPLPNIVVSQTRFHCYRHSAGDSACSINSMLDKQLEVLMKKVPNVYIYDYFTYSWDGMPFPVAPVLAKELRYYKEVGVYGFMTEVPGSLNPSWRSFRTAFYTLAAMLWNPELPLEELRRDFCRKRYGKAADIMEKFFILQEKSLLSINECFLKKAPDFERILTESVQMEGERLLTEAESIEKDNSFLRDEAVLFRSWIVNSRERGKYRSPKSIQAHPAENFSTVPFEPSSIRAVDFATQLPDLQNDTRIMLFNGEKQLAIRMRMNETQMNNLKIPPQGSNLMPIYNSDCVELFLADGKDPKRIYHFLIAPDGQVAASACLGSNWNWSWKHDAKIVSRRGLDFWEIDFMLDKKEINEESNYRFTFARNRRAGYESTITGAPDGCAFFDSAKYIEVYGNNEKR